MNSCPSSVPESATQITSSFHGRQRRLERGISEYEFDQAVRYGIKTISSMCCPRTGADRWEYSYNGITCITDKTSKLEITSWVHSAWGINIEKVNITAKMRKEHAEAVRASKDFGSWLSHAVIVVDQSGSMRKTDGTNGVTRSDMVWLTLAIDYVGKRLRSGEATSQDYFTLVAMSKIGEVLLKHQPINWVLYNRLIDFLRERHPIGDGNYLPAIDKAKEFLLSNKSGRCALQLVILSDGAPSDRAPRKWGGQTVDYHQYALANQIADLATRFGSRLTIGGIAIGSGDINALNSMVKHADEYNCNTFTAKATLCIQDLASAFSIMSPIMTSTKTTMTGFGTNQQRTCRDLRREPKSVVNTYIEKDTGWKIHNDYNDNVYRAIFDKEHYIWIYPKQIFNNESARGIAIRGQIFGEGSERAVRRVQEVDADVNFVGLPLVGKETRYIEDLEKHSDTKEFHKTFCKVQQLAQRLAISFKKKVLALPGSNPYTTPTIHFLHCYVMMYDNNNISGSGLLVEKMLDHSKYKKWNTNDGYVNTTRPSRVSNRNKGDHNFYESKCEGQKDQYCTFEIEDIPQAFSHYTYLMGGRKFVVCDLQGVLNTTVKPPVFEMTDPAIHYAKKTSRRDLGRTDNGEEGINNFFKSHKCSNLCHLLMRRWIKNPLDNDIIAYEETKVNDSTATKKVRFAL